MSRWVTDKNAIYTLVMLRGLRPGDEIKVERMEAYCVSRVPDGTVVEVLPDDEFVWDTKQWPHLNTGEGHDTPVARVCDERGDFYVALWNIKAWRRPNAKPKL